jgi:hypothetical protein
MKGGSLGIVLGDFFRPRPRVENPWLRKAMPVETLLLFFNVYSSGSCPINFAERNKISFDKSMLAC